MDFALVLILGLIAGAVGGIVGFGTSIMLMPALVLVFGPREAVPIMAIASIMANASRVAAWWREVDWRVTAAYSATGIPAAALGARTLLTLSPGVVEMALGIFFIGMIPVRRWMARQHWKPTLWHMAGVGAVIGFITGIVVSTGPINAPFFLAYGLVSIVILAALPRRRVPTASQMVWALGLSVLGFTGYYWFLVLAIRDAGTEVPTLIIGTIPLWVMALGKPAGLRWAALLPGLVLTATGLALMVNATAPAGASAAAPAAFSAARLCALRPTTRTVLPCESRMRAALEVMLPLEPSRTNMMVPFKKVGCGCNVTPSCAPALSGKSGWRIIYCPEFLNNMKSPGINLDRIAAFVAVADAGSFTAAAERMDVAKSAVSHAVARLERELGAQLLQRSTRKLSITAEWQANDVLNNRALDGDIGSNGSTVADRARAAGYAGEVAETVAINPALAINGIDIMNQWFSRPDYKATMVNCGNMDIGVWSVNDLDRSVLVAVYGRGDAAPPVPAGGRQFGSPSSPP